MAQVLMRSVESARLTGRETPLNNSFHYGTAVPLAWHRGDTMTCRAVRHGWQMTCCLCR
ncbi:hypothetical protein B9Z19DRAFT_1096783 [Tuber borchii]|uniref:Uncharacterized protein n=1 Tax=Tuber borchii TaxID=42251 RepID=A0A2T6ZB92_TUBBO|nr:hypothetical protein B9Z19DRAFT_1096783 [Tuber borchii]